MFGRTQDICVAAARVMEISDDETPENLLLRADLTFRHPAIQRDLFTISGRGKRHFVGAMSCNFDLTLEDLGEISLEDLQDEIESYRIGNTQIAEPADLLLMAAMYRAHFFPWMPYTYRFIQVRPPFAVMRGRTHALMLTLNNKKGERRLDLVPADRRLKEECDVLLVREKEPEIYRLGDIVGYNPLRSA